MVRVPRGYVSPEAEAAIKGTPPLDLEQEVAVYEERYRFKRGRACMVCDSQYRGLIEELFKRNASRRSISRFLAERYGEHVGETSLDTHRVRHMGG